MAEAAHKTIISLFFFFFIFSSPKLFHIPREIKRQRGFDIPWHFSWKAPWDSSWCHHQRWERGQRRLSSPAQMPGKRCGRRDTKNKLGAFPFFFPLQGRAHRLRLRVIHSQPVDVGAHRSVPISQCPHPPACPDLPAQVTQNQIQTQSNSSIPSSGCSLGAGIPLISSTIPLGIGEDIKRSCFQFPSSKGFINKRCG